jgi:hypothetical protein
LKTIVVSGGTSGIGEAIRTGFAGEFDAPTAAYVAEMKRIAQPVEVGIAPIITIIDTPPREPLSAFVEGRRISLLHPSFDTYPAARLDARTRELLQQDHRRSIA